MSQILVLLALTQATATAAPVEVRGPHEMTRSEIRAYNARLTPDHPNYIRCRREEETGSLVRSRATCRTNEEWQRIEDQAGDEARTMVDQAGRSGSSSGN